MTPQFPGYRGWLRLYVQQFLKCSGVPFCPIYEHPSSGGSIFQGLSGLARYIYFSRCASLSLLVLSSAIFHASSGISTSCNVSHQFLQVPKAILAACWTVSLGSCSGCHILSPVNLPVSITKPLPNFIFCPH